jgi:Spy/CpxP family protein refolding chaperone
MALRRGTQCTGGKREKQINDTRTVMRLTKTSLAIIAVAGALALSPSSRAQTNTPAGGRNARGRGAEQQLGQLSEQLKLTDEQKTKVKTVLEEQQKKAQELRSDTSISQQDMRTKRQAIMQDTGKKMKENLTAEQFKKYEEWRQQQRGRGGANGAAGARPNRNRNGTNTTNGASTAGGQ